MCYFFQIFKNQNVTTIDAVKRTIEAVTEIWLKSEIPIKSSWLHSKLLKSFESWKKFVIDASRKSIQAFRKKHQSWMQRQRSNDLWTSLPCQLLELAIWIFLGVARIRFG